MCLLVSTISLTAFRPCTAAGGTKWVPHWNMGAYVCNRLRLLLFRQASRTVTASSSGGVRQWMHVHLEKSVIFRGYFSKYIVSLVFFFLWLSASPSLPPFVHHWVCSPWQDLLNRLSSFSIMLSKVTYPFLLSEKANILDSSNYEEVKKTFAEIVWHFFVLFRDFEMYTCLSAVTGR